MRITAICHTCRHQHAIDFDPLCGPGAAFGDWLAKHPLHLIDFAYPQRRQRDATPSLSSWEDYLHNADVKVAYGSSADYTITLASLATSSTKVAGRESTAVDNTTNKYLDFLVAGKITTGTSPTDTKSIEIWAYGSTDDTPTYPDVLDGSDSAETFTSVDIRNAAANFLMDTATNNTSDRPYWFKPTPLSLAFGPTIPKHHGLWVTHDTGVNLNSTGGNHDLSYTPAYATVT